MWQAVQHVLHDGPRMHTVGPRENLADIALLYYGHASKWPAIYRHNTHTIANPNDVTPGQQLVIPYLEPHISRELLEFSE